MRISGVDPNSGEAYEVEVEDVSTEFIDTMSSFEMSDEQIKRMIDKLNISADAKSLLYSFSKTTIRVGEYVLRIGRKIIDLCRLIERISRFEVFQGLLRPAHGDQRCRPHSKGNQAGDRINLLLHILDKSANQLIGAADLISYVRRNPSAVIDRNPELGIAGRIHPIERLRECLGRLSGGIPILGDVDLCKLYQQCQLFFAPFRPVG